MPIDAITAVLCCAVIVFALTVYLDDSDD